MRERKPDSSYSWKPAPSKSKQVNASDDPQSLCRRETKPLSHLYNFIQSVIRLSCQTSGAGIHPVCSRAHNELRLHLPAGLCTGVGLFICALDGKILLFFLLLLPLFIHSLACLTTAAVSLAGGHTKMTQGN